MRNFWGFPLTIHPSNSHPIHIQLTSNSPSNSHPTHPSNSHPTHHPNPSNSPLPMSQNVYTSYNGSLAEKILVRTEEVWGQFEDSCKLWTHRAKKWGTWRALVMATPTTTPTAIPTIATTLPTWTKASSEFQSSATKLGVKLKLWFLGFSQISAV